MATITLRGWQPGSKKPLIPLVKSLRANLGCSLPEAVEMAEECTYFGKTVIREGVPTEAAQKLGEELQALGFESMVE